MIEKKNLCRVATEMSIPRRSLTRYCSNAKKIGANLSPVVEIPTFVSFIGGYKLRTVTIAEYIAMPLLVYPYFSYFEDFFFEGRNSAGRVPKESFRYILWLIYN